jgi:outer membrane protein OmpA-like peptidoglycan-associated protein
MRIAAAVLGVVLAACAGGEKAPVDTEQLTPAAAQPAAAVAPKEPDFEPADAQARAESVLHADFNRNKTTRLEMHMSTIVGKTSALEGFSTAVVQREEKIDDKLSRLAARVTETEVVIQLPGSILFDFDSASLRPDAERALDDLRQIIASYSGRPVRIEGHTDSIASDEYNLTLSGKRAAAVAAWLTGHGIDRARLSTLGLGETKPAAPNDTSSGRQKNRRVEVIIARK